MNRQQRRAGQRAGTVCEHGYEKKTDGTGTPMCPHWCGFEHPSTERPIGVPVSALRERAT